MHCPSASAELVVTASSGSDNIVIFKNSMVADMATGGGHCGREFRSMRTFFSDHQNKEIKIIGELSQDLLACIEFIAAFQVTQKS